MLNSFHFIDYRQCGRAPERRRADATQRHRLRICHITSQHYVVVDFRIVCNISVNKKIE
jgi:hypothetical protein